MEEIQMIETEGKRKLDPINKVDRTHKKTVYEFMVVIPMGAQDV